MPKVWTGNFAQVYELWQGAQRWAVKCFTRSAPDAQHRYAAISQALQEAKLSYFVEFRFLPDEILVNGRRFPVVRMEWVEGLPLDRWIERHLYRPDEISRLAVDLFAMVSKLERHGIAHGDLQHGNILLQGSSVKLVDYDGMFVPALTGHRAS
jgi:predicted Ser/Thr protein kinase